MMDYKSSKYSLNASKPSAGKNFKPNWGLNNRLTYKKGSILVLSAVFLLTSAFFVYKHYANKKNDLATQNPQAFGSSIPGWWIDQYYGQSVCDNDSCAPDSDPDQDKLTNFQEYYYHSDPLNKDTNANGLTDGQDVAQNFDPSKPGKVTFTELESDENVLGESLAFDKDIQRMISDSFDISKVNLPLVSDNKLDIVTEENDQVYKNYQNNLQSTVNKYFPDEAVDQVLRVLGSDASAEKNQVATKAQTLAIELTFMQVPERFVAFHKYNIAIYQLIYDIVTLDDYKDSNDAQGQIWFDKTQALLAASQKLSLEQKKLFQQ